MNLEDLIIQREPYTYIPAGQIGEVIAHTLDESKHYKIIVKAIEVNNVVHHCAIYHCDFAKLRCCVGCRCIAGSRKDGKCVTFEIQNIEEIECNYGINN